MAKKVARYHFSKKFKKEYQKLSKEIQKTFDEKLDLFLNDISHPSFRVKRIQGTKKRWEVSITKSYRFTFQFHNDTVIFRAIGTHEILKREALN